jgi:hypothetical protein
MLAGLIFLGVFIDFLSVLIIQQNMPNNGIVAILSYIWFAPVIITAMYIGVELLLPKIKIYIIILIVIISILFKIVIFIYPLDSFNFIPDTPTPPPVNLIDYNVNLITLAGMLMGGMLLTFLIFLGFGFLYIKVFNLQELYVETFCYYLLDHYVSVYLDY